MERLTDGLKKILLAGIGTVAVTAEKSKEVLDEMVKRGELTVEQGKVLNQELKHNIKDTVKKNVNVSVKPQSPEELEELLDKMTPEQIQALKNKQFVLEANQVIFRNGMSAFVTSNTNFVLMNGNRATVQTAFNTAYPGPNGIGGVTVDGNSSDMKMNIDKKGNVNCSFSVQGIGISAQVFINMSSGNNTASVTISPNFNNNNLTLNGNIVPLDQSNIFKGRSW